MEETTNEVTPQEQFKLDVDKLKSMALHEEAELPERGGIVIRVANGWLYQLRTQTNSMMPAVHVPEKPSSPMALDVEEPSDPPAEDVPSVDAEAEKNNTEKSDD